MLIMEWSEKTHTRHTHTARAIWKVSIFNAMLLLCCKGTTENAKVHWSRTKWIQVGKSLHFQPASCLLALLALLQTLLYGRRSPVQQCVCVCDYQSNLVNLNFFHFLKGEQCQKVSPLEWVVQNVAPFSELFLALKNAHWQIGTFEPGTKSTHTHPWLANTLPFFCKGN